MSKESKQRFTSAMAELKAKLSTEVLEEVNGLLSSINREFLDVEGDVNALYKESITRKEGLTALQTELDNLKQEKQSLESMFSDSAPQLENLTKERDEYKSKFESYLESEKKQSREKWVNYFDQIKEHTDFERTKNHFKIPEMIEDKLDWDSLDADAFKHNLSKLDEYKSLGHFQDGSGSPITPANRDLPKNSAKEPWEEYK